MKSSTKLKLYELATGAYKSTSFGLIIYTALRLKAFAVGDNTFSSEPDATIALVAGLAFWLLYGMNGNRFVRRLQNWRAKHEEGALFEQFMPKVGPYSAAMRKQMKDDDLAGMTGNELNPQVVAVMCSYENDKFNDATRRQLGDSASLFQQADRSGAKHLRAPDGSGDGRSFARQLIEQWNGVDNRGTNS